MTRVGPPEVLVVREDPEPIPGPGEVLVDVRASGVNFADIMARLGLYPDAPKLPAVVGYEVAGVVQAVGRDVHRFRPGDRVIGLCRFGGYAERIALPESQLFPLPENLSFEEGAAVPVNYLTAFQALDVMATAKPGDTVLVHSAGGGVGLAALDICRLVGADVIAIASASKHARLRERNVVLAIDGRATDWEREVRKATRGRGVDIALDPNGGGSWRKSYRCLAPTGRLVVYGFAAAATGPTRSLGALLRNVATLPWLELNPLRLIADNKAIVGINLGHLWDEGARVRRWGETILRHVAEGRLRPHVDRAFPFAEAASAHRYLQERRNFGKVVLVP